MSDEEWDAESFEPKDFSAAAAPRTGTRWDGEDEDENVKDNWEEEDDPDKKEEAQQSSEKPPAQVKKKKVKDIVKEERKLREAELSRPQPKTPQEIYEDKIRQQKLQEESDLLLARETFGASHEGTFDSMDPSSKEDFENYRKSVADRLLKYEKSAHFVPFLDDLFRDLCIGLEADDIKKISSTLNALCNEKVKAAKATKSKKKSAGSKRATLVVSRGNDFDDYTPGNEFDDFI
jgi:translation initiation factor 3 subunit J